MLYKKAKVRAGSGSSYDGHTGTIVELIGDKTCIVKFNDGVELPFIKDELIIK
jgi:hypothetical protein